jgi:hypothetical protein
MTRSELIRYLRASVRGLSRASAEDAIQDALLGLFEDEGVWLDEGELERIRCRALTRARQHARMDRRERSTGKEDW